jgi:hypothetical protein
MFVWIKHLFSNVLYSQKLFQNNFKFILYFEAINPGQPALPDWVHQGAIIGIQGGTDRMLEVLNQVN